MPKLMFPFVVCWFDETIFVSINNFFRMLNLHHDSKETKWNNLYWWKWHKLETLISSWHYIHNTYVYDKKKPMKWNFFCMLLLLNMSLLRAFFNDTVKNINATVHIDTATQTFTSISDMWDYSLHFWSLILSQSSNCNILWPKILRCLACLFKGSGRSRSFQIKLLHFALSTQRKKKKRERERERERESPSI